MTLIRLFARLAAYVMITLLLVPFAVLLRMFTPMAFKQRFVQFYYYLAAHCFGLRVISQGKLVADRPLLVVSNHCSYLDIPALGSTAPVHFTPKSDVRGWPVIGWMCHVSDCVFINRSRQATQANQQQLIQRLQQGWPISLFPEGTTNNGMAVLPFRSSYFSIANEIELTIQPVSIRYQHHDGTALSAAETRQICWIDDDEFFPHLFAWLRCPSVTVVVEFLPPIMAPEWMQDRKALAQQAHQLVSNAFAIPKKERHLQEVPLDGG